MRRLRARAIVPSSGSRRPASRLSRVDFPAPLGPTSPIRSYSSIRKLTSAKMRSAPNDFPTCMTLTIGIAFHLVMLHLFIVLLPDQGIISLYPTQAPGYIGRYSWKEEIRMTEAKRVIVTGATGLIGSSLFQELVQLR